MERNDISEIGAIFKERREMFTHGRTESKERNGLLFLRNKF